LNFVSLSRSRITDKLAFNWQNFARVRLQLKFAFIIRPIMKQRMFISMVNRSCNYDQQVKTFPFIFTLVVVPATLLLTRNVKIFKSISKRFLFVSKPLKL